MASEGWSPRIIIAAILFLRRILNKLLHLLSLFVLGEIKGIKSLVGNLEWLARGDKRANFNNTLGALPDQVP